MLNLSRRLLGAPPATGRPSAAPALALVGARDVALWLHSRAGLPAFVTVLAARTNPWLGGCPEVTVEMWKAGSERRSRLDTKTFQLVDGWLDGVDDLWSWGSTLDCLNTTTLTAGAYVGDVVFVVIDPRSARELGRSGPFRLGTLPAGSAIDEQPTFTQNAAATVAGVVAGTAEVIAAGVEGGGDILNATGLPSLLKWTLFGAAIGAVVVFGPALLDAVDR